MKKVDLARRAEIGRLKRELPILLSRLHQQGVAHLDILPTNIMYKRTGNQFVFYWIDFGNSKLNAKKKDFDEDNQEMQHLLNHELKLI